MSLESEKLRCFSLMCLRLVRFFCTLATVEMRFHLRSGPPFTHTHPGVRVFVYVLVCASPAAQ